MDTHFSVHYAVTRCRKMPRGHQLSMPTAADPFPLSRRKVRSGNHDSARLRSGASSRASLHPVRSMVEVAVSSHSHVRCTEAASTVSLWPPRQAHAVRASALTSRVTLSNRCAGLFVIARELAVDVCGLYSFGQTFHPDPRDLDRASSAPPTQPSGKRGSNPWVGSSAPQGMNWLPPRVVARGLAHFRRQACGRQ